jgi:hypothetical protein
VNAKNQVRRRREGVGPEPETDRVEAVPENRVLRSLRLREVVEVRLLHCNAMGIFKSNQIK